MLRGVKTVPLPSLTQVAALLAGFEATSQWCVCPSSGHNPCRAIWAVFRPHGAFHGPDGDGPGIKHLRDGVLYQAALFWRSGIPLCGHDWLAGIGGFVGCPGAGFGHLVHSVGRDEVIGECGNGVFVGHLGKGVDGGQAVDHGGQDGPSKPRLGGEWVPLPALIVDCQSGLFPAARGFSWPRREKDLVFRFTDRGYVLSCPVFRCSKSPRGHATSRKTSPRFGNTLGRWYTVPPQPSKQVA